MAAVTVAGSTFAWFTSTDDVTNRLTASADYGVSIVESFAPPVNWIPGQPVNKDVFDVNTGSIDAFVKNAVSAKITYTYETLVNSVDTTYGVQLTNDKIADIDGATTMEAGSFLAWTDSGESLGAKISERATGADANRWTPDKTGVYIFRRATNGTGYTYAGYYYDNTTGKYYKIVIGGDKDSFPAVPDSVTGNDIFDVSSVSLGTGVTIDSEGKVTDGTPSIKYVVETKVNNADITYRYDSTNKQLVFEYTAQISGSTDVINGETYDASALAARAEVDYENAKAFSEHAEKLYNNAQADLDYAAELAKQRNALIDAAKTANTDAETTSTKKTAKDNAWDDIFDDTAGILKTLDANFNTTFGASFTSIDPSIGKGFVPENVIQAANEYKTAGDSTSGYKYPQVHANYDRLTTLYSLMSGYKTRISDAITDLKGFESNADKDTDPADIQAQVNIILSNMESYTIDLNEYYTKYAGLVNSASTDTSISIGTSDANAKKQLISTAQTNLSTTSGNADTLNTDSGEYKTKYDEWYSAKSTSDESLGDWNTAVTTYNTKVTEAETDYTTAISSTGVNQNHAGTLVPTYSAVNAENPQITIPATPGTVDYTSYAAMDKVTVPTDIDVNLNYTYAELDDASDSYVEKTATETKKVSEWKTFMGTKKTAEGTAKDNYDDAKLRVDTSSTITINVKLADDYADNWTYDDKNTVGNTVANFYLNKILGAGITSDKLIDSVELADTVKASDYKDLTFDLNVGLKSAQVTYDNNRNVQATAVTAPDFAKTATVGNDNSTVTWN